MNPFYFGPADRPLYGACTLAPAASDPPRCVLLCYPLGSEYMRAHRAFRQLNNLLNRAGIHVLRFDYSCTGDSAGAGVDAAVETWLEDIDWAVDELKDMTMVPRISMVGLRWGATLAALAARRRDDIEQLILWDPITRGRTYLDARLDQPRPTGVVGLDGFPLSPALVAELDAIDLVASLSGAAGPDQPTTTIIVSDEQSEYRSLGDALTPPGAPSRLQLVHSSGDWGHADPFGDALIPQQIIQAIVASLSRSSQPCPSPL